MFFLKNEFMLADQSCQSNPPIVPPDIVLGKEETCFKLEAEFVSIEAGKGHAKRLIHFKRNQLLYCTDWDDFKEPVPR